MRTPFLYDLRVLKLKNKLIILKRVLEEEKSALQAQVSKLNGDLNTLSENQQSEIKTLQSQAKKQSDLEANVEKIRKDHDKKSEETQKTLNSLTAKTKSMHQKQEKNNQAIQDQYKSQETLSKKIDELSAVKPRLNELSSICQNALKKAQQAADEQKNLKSSIDKSVSEFQRRVNEDQQENNSN